MERDACAIWWYNRLRVPGVDLECFGDDYLAATHDYYRRHHRESWVLDVTGDLGMPVARVMVPGLRHFWERFAPGRLFDVPVDMGRRTSPLAESDLNPAPVIA